MSKIELPAVAIQDFPEEAPTYYLTIFPKTAWKWKKFAPEGGVPRALTP